MSPGWVRVAIREAIPRSGLKDENGAEYKFTPHDFRRLFATSALSSGLPIHILAKLMGHQNISTTQGYAAIHDEETLRHFRSFLDRRRALRPTDDYLEPSDAEIRDFHEHSRRGRSNSEAAVEPMGRPAFTNMPAYAALCSAPTPHNVPAWKN